MISLGFSVAPEAAVGHIDLLRAPSPWLAERALPARRTATICSPRYRPPNFSGRHGPCSALRMQILSCCTAIFWLGPATGRDLSLAIVPWLRDCTLVPPSSDGLVRTRAPKELVEQYEVPRTCSPRAS